MKAYANMLSSVIRIKRTKEIFLFLTQIISLFYDLWKGKKNLHVIKKNLYMDKIFFNDSKKS